jgi:hypothetical protein
MTRCGHLARIALQPITAVGTFGVADELLSNQAHRLHHCKIQHWPPHHLGQCPLPRPPIVAGWVHSLFAVCVTQPVEIRLSFTS